MPRDAWMFAGQDGQAGKRLVSMLAGTPITQLRVASMVPVPVGTSQGGDRSRVRCSTGSPSGGSADRLRGFWGSYRREKPPRCRQRRLPATRQLPWPYAWLGGNPGCALFGEITMKASNTGKTPSNPSSGSRGRDELSYRLRQQSLLGEFGRAAMQTRDLKMILQKATELCASGLQAQFAKVLEY